jgi:triosephosphate isomerase (TIM)
MAQAELIVGNWKMHGTSSGKAGVDGLKLVAALAARLREGPKPRCDLVVCPPATLLARVAELARGSSIAIGGQDCHAKDYGAHTGDVSAEMLADAGCRFVIVGHSERRSDHGETDALVRAKAAAAHRAGLVAIVCVGETEAKRLAGRANDVVGRQIADSLPEGADPSNTVVAYEPVWAIGTGRTPTTEDIAAMHGFIRKTPGGRKADLTGMRILYGGSVKASNAVEILGLAEVDGALVGGASLKADEFWAIAQACR